MMTGATGVVGRPVLARLLGRGLAVTVLALPETVCELPPHPALAVIAGGVEEPACVARAARGADVVVHAAAVLPGGSRADLERVNVDGTENVLLAAAEARARRFVLLSSTAVYADAPERTWPIAEDHPLGPTSPPSIGYGRSKIAAEALVTRFRRRHRLECAILRPPTVYGPGARLPERLVGDLLDRPLAALGSPLAGVPMQWVHAGDLAAAVVAAATLPDLRWTVCNVAGGELFDLRGLARVVQGVHRQTGPLAAALLHAPSLPMLPLRYDLTRAASILGWRPATPLRDGIAGMLRAMSPPPARRPAASA